MIIIGRHANRVDNYDIGWGKKFGYDPSLSGLGFTQVNTLVKLLERDNLKIDKIHCSPFLRTIQTAMVIKKNIKATLFVEPLLSEWLNPKWFSYSPLNDLAYLALQEKNAFSELKYPEQYNNLKERLSSLCTSFISNSESHLFISHKLTIQAIGDLLEVNLSDFDECEFREIKYIEGRWKIERVWNVC